MSLRKTVLIRTPQHPPPTNRLCQNTAYGFAPDIRSRPAYTRTIALCMWRKTILLGIVVLSLGCEDRGAEVGFWFDPIAFDSPQLKGPITPEELATIEAIARSEIATAFQGLPISFSARRDAR